MTSGFHHGHWGTLLPFLRACQRLGEPQKPVAKPQQLPKLPVTRLRRPATDIPMAKNSELQTKIWFYD